MMKCEAEKNIFKNGFVNIAFEKYLLSKSEIINVGLRYNFSAAQGLISVRQSNKTTLLTQTARGSILYNTKANSITLTNQNSVGKGGLYFKAFLDLNNNGKKDNDEPAAPGLKFNIRGGRINRNLKILQLPYPDLRLSLTTLLKLIKVVSTI